MKSSPAGHEVKIVAYSTDVIPVAARRHPTLKHHDLVRALGVELARVHTTVPHVYNHREAPEYDRVDRLASAVQGRMGYRLVQPSTGRPPRLAATEVK